MSNQLWNTAIVHKITPNEIYVLDCYRSKVKPYLIDAETERISCINKGFLDEENNLTNKGAAVLNDFEMYLVKTKKKVSTELLGANCAEKINEFRELFPAKRLPSGQLARQSYEELKQKFVWFFKTYPEYDWDLILDATQYYNIVFKRKGYQYMATSSNFIKKTDNHTKEISSKLADYCQEILDNPSVLDNL